MCKAKCEQLSLKFSTYGLLVFLWIKENTHSGLFGFNLMTYMTMTGIES